MCDWVSWIEKDGKLYWCRDDEIEAKYGEVTNDHCGHSTIRKVHGVRGGIERESALKIPAEIAASVNRGEMNQLAKAGGWHGAHYTRGGVLNSPWWKRYKAELKKYEGIAYTLDNHGPVDPAWKIFNTWTQAWAQARAQARDQAWAQANVIACSINDGYESSKYYKYFRSRLAVWEAGYGCLCDINGVFYVYKKF